MAEPIVTALTTAMDASAKIASSPGPMAFADRLFGFKLSEWIAQGEVVRQQINDEYKDAREKGLGMQYATAIREKTNVLNTLSKVASHIKEGFEREIDLEEDVFWNLLDHAKAISDEDVQELIARIIAGEYNQKGAYSMSALQILKSLGKNELEVLEKVASLLLNNSQLPENLFRAGNENYRELLQNIEVSYNDFLTLQSLGLFYAKSATSVIPNPTDLLFKVSYFGRELVYKSSDENKKDISVPGYYELTKVGGQIVQHLNPQPNEYYFNWIIENYTVPRYQIVR